ncbi:MAG: hypothetical protein ACM3U1_11620 [Chloroflexota bacterium]
MTQTIYTLIIFILSAMPALAEDSLRVGGQQAPANDEGEYLPRQDSAYYRDLMNQAPLSEKVRFYLKNSDARWGLMTKMRDADSWRLALRNLENLPPDVYAPDPVESMLFRENIAASQYIPFFNTMPPFRQSFSLHSIGSLLGIVEDVSPVIKYSLDYKTEVEVVIYSVRAQIVATLFKGEQSPGTYTLTWNLRDSLGRAMPSDDYVAEVRIGKERVVRKRITIP